MSLYDKCISCDGSEANLESLLKSLFRIDSEGNVGIEVKLNVCSVDSTPAAKCGIDTNLEQVTKGSIVIDECNHCALKLFVDPTSIGEAIRNNEEILEYICDYCLYGNCEILSKNGEIWMFCVNDGGLFDVYWWDGSGWILIWEGEP